jgi:hypothetical protein
MHLREREETGTGNLAVIKITGQDVLIRIAIVTGAVSEIVPIPDPEVLGGKTNSVAYVSLVPSLGQTLLKSSSTGAGFVNTILVLLFDIFPVLC